MADAGAEPTITVVGKSHDVSQVIVETYTPHVGQVPMPLSELVEPSRALPSTRSS